MGRITHEGLAMAKRWATPRTRAIWGGMWLVQYENKVGTIEGIHSLNFQGEIVLNVFKNHHRKTTC
jgi:hypothetical protein